MPDLQLLTAQELEDASIDDIPGLLLKKVLNVVAEQPDDEALVEQASELLTTKTDARSVATAVQLHSVFHKEDSCKKLVPLLEKLNVGRFRDAFMESVADTNILQALGVSSLNVLAKKLRIINTNVYARQHKFNLLVEEPEGYSKFLYAATHGSCMDLEPIIGTFSLDGNRCLDILLNLIAYEIRQKSTQEQLGHLTDAIQRLDTGKLPQLLGFMSRRKDDTDVILVTIHLVRQQVIRLEEILPYMDDDSVSWHSIVQKVYDDYVALEKVRTKRINRISLASSNTATDDGKDPSANSVRAPLESLFVTKVILELRMDAYEKLPDADWSKLATLFPNTIGLAIVDHCAELLRQFMDDPKDEAELLRKLESPLRTIRDAGCIKYCPEFFIRLCRCIQDPTIWKDLLRTVLVPSSSVFDPNPSIHLELWEVLKKFGYEDRYHMYEYWKEDPEKAVWMMEMEALVLKDARYSLRRLSKETVRDLSRAVAKCCFRNPIVVFTTILNQIESYDNLVGVMVDVCRFVSPLGLDVLGFCILQRLTAARRNRLKESGVHASQWLQSLESFTGKFYKRYPYVEFQGLVTYLRRRLEDGQVIELGMLQALLTTVGGFKFKDYSPIAGLTAAQLQGRSGSTVLQRETMAFGVVEGIDWKSAKQVRKVLQKDGTALLILLAQVQYQIIFGSGDDKPVKLIGNLVDTCKVVMSVLLDFMTNYRVDDKAIEDYANALPSFEDLIGQYEVDSAITWQLYRPIYREAVCGDSDGLQSFIPTDKSRIFFKTLLPSRSWSHITVDLFEFFCTTSLYDIHCPTEVYETELKRLEREIERLSQKKIIPGAQQSGVGDEATIEHAKKVVAYLKSDLKKQTNHAEETLSSLKKRREKFMATDQVTREGAMTFFVNLIYRRCLQGPDDAMYCAYFMTELNRNETKGFGTLHVYDCIIVTMSRSLFGLTEGEAACASILLFELWTVISACRFDEKEFNAVFAGKPGAIMGEEQEPITFEAYKKLYDKWHTEIAAACVGCLNSSEYIHLRNCLVVLSRMVDIYPTKPPVANKFLQKLEPLQEESNSMADIRAAARAYNMQILQARDDGAWKEEDDATTKARLAKVEAAAAERQKRAKQTMAQIQKDSEKISEEIGEWSSRDRNRRHEGDDRRADSRRRNDERRNMRPAPQGGQHADRWPRDRAPQGAAYPVGARDRDVAPVRGGREEPRGGRDDTTNRSHDANPRTRGAEMASPNRHDARKRSRPSSPLEQGEARDDTRASSTKRVRNDADEKPAEGEGGRRRNKSNRRNNRRN